MSTLSTHVLDTAIGKPAAGIAIVLEHEEANGWRRVGTDSTNADGRAKGFATAPLEAGNYRFTFDVAPYFSAQQQKCFFPTVQIAFTIDDERHYHVPLLISPYGYSTYRGS
ncbi:hydroxyisourate hydrolase [soil metagenome]